MPDQPAKAYIPVVEPRSALAGLVLARVRKEERFLRWQTGRLALRALVAMACMAGLVPALQSLSAAAVRSGFLSYISLIATDGAFTLRTWQDYLFSLLESLPVFSLATSLCLLFILILSVRSGLKGYVHGQTMQKSAIA